MNESSPGHHSPPDLTRRFRTQICFPETGDPEKWETVISKDTLIEAIRSCSECLESVRYLVEQAMAEADVNFDVDAGFVSLRVHDNEVDSVVVWQDDSGRVCFRDDPFEEVLTAKE